MGKDNPEYKKWVREHPIQSTASNYFEGGHSGTKRENADERFDDNFGEPATECPLCRGTLEKTDMQPHYRLKGGGYASGMEWLKHGESKCRNCGVVLKEGKMV